MTDFMSDVLAPIAIAGAESIWALVFIADPLNRMYYVYLLSFVAISCLMCIFGRAKDLSLVQFLIPRRVYTSVSFITDLKIYLLNGLLLSVVSLGAILGSTTYLASEVSGLLTELFGARGGAGTPGPGSTIVFSVAFVLTMDLGLFIAHYIGHRVPFFWAFHKVHHSAKVLTPVTAFRFHPVDLALTGSVTAFCVGPLVGAYQFLFDEHLVTERPSLFIYVSLAFLLTANFRHSHISLHYPQALSRWLVSPAMHNLHHSTDPAHFDKNLGIMFSIWDRMAGMYFLPRKDVPLTYGIDGKQENDYRGLVRCYAFPIAEAGMMIVNATKRISNAVR